MARNHVTFQVWYKYPERVTNPEHILWDVVERNNGAVVSIRHIGRKPVPLMKAENKRGHDVVMRYW